VSRGVAPVHRLWEAGITCSISTNNVLNPFTPYGDASLVRMANFYANVAQIGSPEGMASCLDMVTHGAAKLLNVTDYGIAAGGPADLVVLNAESRGAVVAELAQPLFGLKAVQARLSARFLQRQRKATSFVMPGRPAQLVFPKHAPVSCFEARLRRSSA
jgi:cytosine/adenosine deaminase-related metal-dependent hydrolase